MSRNSYTRDILCQMKTPRLETFSNKYIRKVRYVLKFQCWRYLLVAMLENYVLSRNT